MSKPISERRWSELEPEQVRYFFRLCADRADSFGALADSAWRELAKYLFAANTGAAAGLFLLLRTAEAHSSYLTAFFLFCGGTFFVGVSYFCFERWSRLLVEGWTADFNSLMRDEIVFAELDRRNRQRHRSWKIQATQASLVVSFLLLMAGGLTAVKPFQSKPANSSADKQPTALIPPVKR